MLVGVGHRDEVATDRIARVVPVAVALLDGRELIQEGVGDP
jgi:hypothetical protein